LRQVRRSRPLADPARGTQRSRLGRAGGIRKGCRATGGGKLSGRGGSRALTSLSLAVLQRGGQMSEQAAGGAQGFFERQFRPKQHGTSLKTEFVAGLTTFLTMLYIVFVNPQILGNAGMDKGAVFVATCIAAAVSTLVMALYANYPIALAPGMGLNAFFAFTVVLTMKYTWQQALAAVFCSGVIFFLISIFRIREYIINSIPKNLKFH